jgi:N-acetylmuramoyl-L-alanine amidase
VRSAVAVFAAICLAAPLSAQDPPLVDLPSTLATMELEGQPSPLPLSPGLAGPLFLLQPLVDRLGGELLVGPLQESHRLRLAEAEVLFGATSGTMTVGREVVVLSQPPALTESGLRVPIDLLRKSYGDLLGLQFRWDSDARVLRVARREAREIGVDLQIVHISGITTIVAQFDQTPSYSVTDNGATVDIEVPVDQVRLERQPQKPRQSHLRGISMNEHLIRLELEPGVQAAEPYVLSSSPGRSAGQGLRLVIDLSRGTETAGGDPKPFRPSGDSSARGLRTIVIDPGHGGPEQGAIGPDGTEEKVLTLILAKALARKLEEELPVRVLLTRQGDADLPLDTRTAMANQNQADLFISVHLNASPDRSAHGAETYFLSMEATDDRAREVAEAENLGT